MKELKLNGMDRLRTTTEQAIILGILKDKEIPNKKIKKQQIGEKFKIQESNIPHTPLFITDDKDNLIATLHHTFEHDAHAELFQKAPIMKNLLWRVFDEVSKSDDTIPLSLDLLNDISEVLTDLEDKKDWKDELYEQSKDEKLPDVFTGEDENNN